jgi:chemotaxis protein methyltransferase WspC
VILSALETLVRDRIGLDPGSISTSTLARAAAARMAARGVASTDAYIGLLNSDPGEWSTLVGELVVPESWFFRGGVEFFEYLAKSIRSKLMDSVNGRVIRVLSVPCSTGEEPYSLALALEKEGVPAERCHIDGVDLARDHLLRAVTGRYPAFSFREAHADPRPQFFREYEPGKWELTAAIRDRVRFRPGNLVEPNLLAGESPYDLIICRNLFIYLTAAGAARALASLERLLAPDGLLCLTAAEADRLPVGRYSAEGPPALAIFKRSTGLANPPRSGIIRISKPTSGVQAKAAPRSGPIAPPPPRSYEHLPLPKPRPEPIAEGRRLADLGYLTEAQAVCEAAPPSAKAFSLLGVIHLAAGRIDAATECFRKALYLEPDHAEALEHMILICNQRGEAEQAAGLRRRLQRIEQGAAP